MEIKALLKSRVVFDVRNQYGLFGIENNGFEYYHIRKA
jgi:UDPglucose 6-dehydrogenase